jgi:hypothetical protein
MEMIFSFFLSCWHGKYFAYPPVTVCSVADEYSRHVNVSQQYHFFDRKWKQSITPHDDTAARARFTSHRRIPTVL